MIEAVRLNELNWNTWQQSHTILMLQDNAQLGDYIVFRPNDTIIMKPEAFDYQYEFAHPEAAFDVVECRVKNTPEARAELLEILEAREELLSEISTIVMVECPYDYIPQDVREIITNKLIEKGWRND